MCQAPRMKQSSHVLSTKDDIVIPCAIHHWNQYRRTLCWFQRLNKTTTPKQNKKKKPQSCLSCTPQSPLGGWYGPDFGAPNPLKDISSLSHHAHRLNGTLRGGPWYFPTMVLESQWWPHVPLITGINIDERSVDSNIKQIPNPYKALPIQQR